LRFKASEMDYGYVRLFLAGDVMTGRGIDQVLPYPSNPEIYEGYVKDARHYVAIAERAHGSIPWKANFSYIWGDALDVWNKFSPDLKIINLETAITTSENYLKGKGINYRMHPKNISCLTAAGFDFCSLANNHVLDWDKEGLIETINVLEDFNIHYGGAGVTLEKATAPAVFHRGKNQRILIYSIGSTSSGIPRNWEATGSSPGIYLLHSFSSLSVLEIKDQIKKSKKSGDIIVVSIHWGGNWGYSIPEEHIDFAHNLIDKARVDVVYGHSSHHFKGIEVYNGKLVLYGCGDFMNDYEGIKSHKEYRDDLTLMYFADLDPGSGDLKRLELVPMQIRNFRLNYVSGKELDWVFETLNRIGKPFGMQVNKTINNQLNLIY